MLAPSDLLGLASPFEKNISLRDLVDAALLIPAIPPLSRGAFRDRHKRWVRDAVDAVVAQDERRQADGEVVWSWRPDAGAKLCGMIHKATGARKPGPRGEREGNR